MLFKCELWPGSICKCELHIHPKSDGSQVVMVTELHRNEGISISSAFEILFDQICETYYLNPERVTYLEHRREQAGIAEQWSLVHFDIIKDRACNPRWQDVTESFVRTVMTYR